MALTRNFQATYQNSKIVIDGNHFEECVFENCLLEYAGMDEVAFVNCRLVNVNWSFVGPASNTISFLSMLRNGFGPTGEALVETLFDQIRRTHITPGLVAEVQSEALTTPLGETVPLAPHETQVARLR